MSWLFSCSLSLVSEVVNKVKFGDDDAGREWGDRPKAETSDNVIFL